MKTRESARVVLFDPDKRVLLCRIHDETISAPGQEPIRSDYWVTVGGGVDPGETLEQAARREVFEETGLNDVVLGDHIWTRKVVLDWQGEVMQCVEQFFTGTTNTIELSTENHTEFEKEVLIDLVWWTLEELKAAAHDTVFFPEAMPELVEELIKKGPPEAPIMVD